MGMLRLLVALLFSLVFSSEIAAVDPAQKLNVVYAVNAGGDKFQDSYGISYQKDPSTQGIASDFGRRLDINRVSPSDAFLYQTERYSHSDFWYDIPIKEDGSYVLVIKFAEVYFQEPGQKVFDVIFNSAHLLANDLDIFATVGYATAYDEIIPFWVSDKGKKLQLGGQTSEILMGKVRLEFVKGKADNPKVNAFYVVKGSIEDVPQLPPPIWDDNNEQEDQADDMFSGEDDEDIHFSRSDLGNDAEGASLLNTGSRYGKIKIRSGIPVEDPWDRESSLVVYMPLLGSIAAFVLSFFVVRLVVKEE